MCFVSTCGIVVYYNVVLAWCASITPTLTLCGRAASAARRHCLSLRFHIRKREPPLITDAVAAKGR